MISVKLIFWLLIISVLYVYIGYGIILFLYVKLFGKRKKHGNVTEEWADITLFITAYNEKDYVEIKMQNCKELDYPESKLSIIWVTDGSDDGTEILLKNYSGVEIYHQPERKGKIAAMNRGMQFVKTQVVVFSDANTIINKDALKIIASKFTEPKVGCVAGEKRIFNSDLGNAASSGEGLYWKYESKLKELEADFHSTVGGAGELFAIRTELFREVEADTLLDDFIISLRIVAMGYIIAYTPDAYASETSSANINEELKRKIRISAGGIQSVLRLSYLLNPFQYGVFAWQFLSHKVLRWLWVPFVLPVIFILNVIIVCLQFNNPYNVYDIIMLLQLIFYIIAIAGWMLQNKKIRLKIFFAPFYIFIMNYAVYLGLFRYIKGSQTVNWERARRA